MYPLKSIWKSMVPETHKVPGRDEKTLVMDTLMSELEYHIKELEAMAREKEQNERRRATGVDYSWLISAPPKSYEIPQLERLELEELCYKVKPEETGKILSLFRDTLYNDPPPKDLPRILKSCISQIIEQRPKEETLTEWVTKRTLSLTRMRTHTRISPSHFVDPEQQETSSQTSVDSISLKSSSPSDNVTEFHHDAESLPVWAERDSTKVTSNFDVLCVSPKICLRYTYLTCHNVYCGWLYFHRYQFLWIELKWHINFVGFKICGHNIFLHNSFRKSLFCWYWNLWIGSSRKTTKIGTPLKLNHSQYSICCNTPYLGFCLYIGILKSEFPIFELKYKIVSNAILA